LRRGLSWVQHQFCVWHVWRSLGSELASAAAQAAEGLAEEAAKQVRECVRRELVALVRGVPVLARDRCHKL
jgi:predicted component of type VI protein secretion system